MRRELFLKKKKNKNIVFPLPFTCKWLRIEGEMYLSFKEDYIHTSLVILIENVQIELRI